MRSHLFASSADTYIHTIPFKILTGSRRLLFPYASPDPADSAACGTDTCLTLIQRELLSRLLVNAFRDITGIHNKTSLENKITELGELPSTFGIGVMMFDLNNLKHVNDTYGHEKGDEFIQTFAYCLTRILDSNSFLARYGGDEFIIIQTDTDSEHLKQMQHRLANLVHDYNNQATLPLSYATGYEISQQNHYFMMEDLINAADKKMYQDKTRKKLAAIKQNSSTIPPTNAVIPTGSSEFVTERFISFNKVQPSAIPLPLFPPM